jgi:hypothetical protein
MSQHRVMRDGVAAQRALPSGATGGVPEPRIVPVDNLKSLLVAWIIACHALLGYASIGGWPYDEVTEVTLPPIQEFLLSVVLGPTALFVVGTFFFLGGLFAPVEIARHGVSDFLKRRMLRLGVPWVLFTVLVWPLFMWFAYRAAGQPMSYWQAFRSRTPFLDSGPLWFVQVLLYLSLGYALWTWLGWGERLKTTSFGGAHLITGAAAIVAASFMVRLIFPARSQQVLDPHLWWLPQCVGMFCLGALASRHHWAKQVPRGLARRCGIAVTSTVVVALLVAVGAGVLNFSQDVVRFLGGWHLEALAFDVVEAVLVVAGSVWLLGLAQRLLTSRAAVLAASARAAYAAFILQAPVLLTLAIAARQFSLPPLAKGVMVGTLAVAVSFSLGWLLVKRTSLGKII